MPKFEVRLTRRTERYERATTVVEAEDEAAALDAAKAKEDELAWESTGEHGPDFVDESCDVDPIDDDGKVIRF